MAVVAELQRGAGGPPVGRLPGGGTAFSRESRGKEGQTTYGFLDFPPIAHSLPLVLIRAKGL